MNNRRADPTILHLPLAAGLLSRDDRGLLLPSSKLSPAFPSFLSAGVQRPPRRPLPRVPHRAPDGAAVRVGGHSGGYCYQREKARTQMGLTKNVPIGHKLLACRYCRHATPDTLSTAAITKYMTQNTKSRMTERKAAERCLVLA